MNISKNKLALAMLKAGIGTQKDLSQRSGVSTNTISAIVRGAKVKVETIGKLAAALKCEPTDILED